MLTITAQAGITGQEINLTAEPWTHKPTGASEVPDDPTAVAMQTAHRLDDVAAHLAHAAERLHAARSADGPMRTYHSGHVAVHLDHALDAGHALAANLRGHYPAEGAELDALTKTIGLARSLSEAARTATTSHLTASVLNDLGHAARHATVLLQPGSEALWAFNHRHAAKHLASAQHHTMKLAAHLRDNYPAEGHYLAGLPVGPRGRERLPVPRGRRAYVRHGADGLTCL